MEPAETYAEHLNWHVDVQVQKWDDSAAHDAGADPDRVDVFEHNLLLNAGITRLINLLTGAGGTAYNVTNSRLGVGISNVAASAAQTDLQGATKYYKLVDSVTPAAQTVTWVATFGTADGNFAWEEWCVDNGSVSSATATAPALNRRAVAMGTKNAGSTWTLTVSITIS